MRQTKIKDVFVVDVKAAVQSSPPFQSGATVELYVPRDPGHVQEVFQAFCEAMRQGLPITVLPLDVPDPCEATHAPEVLEDE
jgi:hypothetical protein